MNPVRTWRMARADFQERSRGFSFLATLAVSLYGGYAFLPPNHARYATLRFGDHRGIYNSAWVGVVIATLSALFVGLVGYYVIKNAVERDRRTGVGQILAASPLTRLEYVLAKALSNLGVLASVGLAMAVSAGITQVVRGEDTRVEIAKLLAPYLILTLPSLAMIAVVAVAFECTPGLRGGGGNVAYFFVWTLAMAASGVGLRSTGRDFLGFGLFLPSMLTAVKEAFPDYDPAIGRMSLGLNFNPTGSWNLTTFVWNGVDWQPWMIGYRLVWVGGAIALAGATALVFDRFAGEGGESRGRVGATKQGVRPTMEEGAPAAPPAFAGHGRLAALAPDSLPVVSSSHLGRLVLAETRLLLKGTSRWWWVVVLGLGVASLLAPVDAGRQWVLPFVAIWPVLRWSALGSRETRFGTDLVLWSTPHPLRLQLPAAWLGGVFVSLIVSGAMIVRLALAAEWGAAGAVVVGSCFVPALALALGVWTGSSRAFEGLFTALWYAGPLQPIPALDFMGASRAAVEMGMPLVFVALTVVLLGAAFVGRQGQMRRS